MAHSYNDTYSGLSASGQVPREDIIKKMKKISREKHIYLSAPGGYGKTVAATQWLTSVRGKKAKLIIDETNIDPNVLNKKIAAAFLKLAGKPAITEKTIPFDRLFEIVRLMPKKSTRCYLVIDDAQKLHNEEWIARVPALIERLPGYIRVCVVSRLEPPPALEKSGLFGYIGKDDLVFSPEEVEWLGAERGIELDGEQIGELLKETGGWIMHLSVILSAGDALKQKSGKVHSTLSQYLEARIWEETGQEMQTYLLCLSLPEKITTELCERLTGHSNGRELLEWISTKEYAFLFPTEKNMGVYRFHDVLREFLLERAERALGAAEVRRLNNIAAEFFFERGDYYTSAKHYINNKDHEGINRCLEASNRYTNPISLEDRLHFYFHMSENLSKEFIEENPFLIHRYALGDFNNGNAAGFFHYLGILYKTLPQIAAEYPALAQTVGVFMALDFRKPIHEYKSYALKLLSASKASSAAASALLVTSITENLPFFHRSQRDYSEACQRLFEENNIAAERAENIALFGQSIGMAVTDLTFAGLYYESGNLQEAIKYALEVARLTAGEETHPEMVFCAQMILSAIFYAMGAEQEADDIMARMEEYIGRRAQFLTPNFKALQTERAIRGGDDSAAYEWLDVYAYRSDGRLPFYQICRHFTALRSYIAVGEYAKAAAFGERLQTLAADFCRPLDQIESGILTAIALRYGGEHEKAARLFEQTVATAMPYGFTQLFVNEGREILPMLWELREGKNKPAKLIQFADKLAEAISKKYKIKPTEKETAPKLTAQQFAMLTYLAKGMTYNEIAAATGIGYGTVKYHVLLVYKKLRVHGAEEAVAKARAFGLLDGKV